MQIPILKQSDLLVATLPPELTDAELVQFREELTDKVGRFRSRGVVVDVTALDVVDSFAARTIREVAHAVRLRGARTVVVGIQPDVAFAMVQLGLSLEGVETVLDLEEGLDHLRWRAAEGGRRG